MSKGRKQLRLHHRVVRPRFGAGHQCAAKFRHPQPVDAGIDCGHATCARHDILLDDPRRLVHDGKAIDGEEAEERRDGATGHEAGGEAC